MLFGIAWLQAVRAESGFADPAFIQNRILRHNAELAAAEKDVELARLNLRMAEAEQLRNADPVKAKLAELELSMAEEAVEILKQELLLQAEEVYYILIKNELETQLTVQTKEYIQTQHELTRAQYQEGLATIQDLDRMILAVAEIDHQLQKLSHEQELARIRLLHLMELPCDHELVIPECCFEFEKPIVEADLRTLLIDNNPELKYTAAQVEVAALRHRLSHPDYTPELIRESNSLEYEKQKLLYGKRVDQLYLQALELQYQVQQLEAQYQEWVQRAKIAEDNLAAAELRYQEGMELSLAVMDSRLELIRIKNQEVGALFAYNIAKARFANLTGLKLGGER
ncbi:MAG: TolC family protein [Firmicutes bacterium]|nr:TolC family protein [Bacillota bacterium]NLL87492.1 TolC family protein [Bacillota bacterium]HKM17881.1 TolC family protein [Limnochordia bacterium]